MKALNAVLGSLNIALAMVCFAIGLSKGFETWVIFAIGINVFFGLWNLSSTEKGDDRY
jgi:hypothetical protein